MKKLIICMLFSVLFLCGIMVSASTEKGYVGNNIKWEFSDSCLTITGNGEIPDFESFSSAPWSSYSGETWNIFIGEGITSIGSCAFSGLYAVMEIDIPDTVTKIGDYAFEGCTYLETLYIPSSVTEIGICAFAGCEYVQKIGLNEGLERIGNGAFSDCDMLESINIPASVTEIGFIAFDGAALTSITVNENNAYYSSDSAGVLYDKKKTKLIQYPHGKSKTSYEVLDGTVEIGKYAFEDCQTIESVSIPYSVLKIGDYAFYNCQKLQKINIPANLREIGVRAFCSCRALAASIVIPRGVTSLGELAFSGCAIDSLEIYGNNAVYGAFVFSDCTALKNVKIEQGAMAEISDGMFYNCAALKSIEIGEGPAYVGKESFYNCNSLSVIQLPDSVADIGDMAFYDCTSLMEIYLGSGFASYYNHNVFDSCEQLQKISVSEENESFYTDGYGVLMNKDKTKVIYYPRGRVLDYEIRDTVVEICEWAFAGTEFDNIDFGKSVEIIGDNAFFNAKVKNITVDEENKNYASVGGVLFDRTKTKLIMYPFGRTEESYDIPNGTTEIKTNAFYRCSLKNVTMPDSLLKIEANAFESCDYLENVTIGKNVTEIGNKAFYTCDTLEAVSVSGSVKTMGSYVFSLCKNLKKAVICEGVTELGDYMFYFSEALETLVLPKTLTAMGDYSLYYCFALNDILYAGTEAEFKKITLGEYCSNFIYGRNKLYNCMPADISTVSCVYKDNKVTANISFEYAIEDGVAILAVYDNKGRLMNTERAVITAGNMSKTIEMAADNNYKNYTAKIMVWDGLNSAVPIASATSKSITY